MKSFAFVSYAREDEDLARALKDRLSDAGIATFIDTTHIRIGDAWREQLRQALRSSFATIVLCTERSIASHEVTFEWAFAAGQGSVVIPILYQRDLEIPAGLKNLDYLDFTEPGIRPWDRLVGRLVSARAEVSATPAVLASLGIDGVIDRDQLVARFSVPQVLSKAVAGSKVIVIGRSLEAWAREFSLISAACTTKSLHVKLGLVDPSLSREQWMVPADYARLDVGASLGKLKMIRLPKVGAGSLHVYYLPSSPIFSFVGFEDSEGGCGVLELGAALAIQDRFAFLLRARATQDGKVLRSAHKVYEGMLEGRRPVYATGAGVSASSSTLGARFRAMLGLR